MSDPIPFSQLKPGDKVVYYQEFYVDKPATANVDVVSSNDGDIIRLKEIWGWKFRVSDGNPVGYSNDHYLAAYIVPTTPALIARVELQERKIYICQKEKEFCQKINWNAEHPEKIKQAYELMLPRCPWTGKPLNE